MKTIKYSILVLVLLAASTLSVKSQQLKSMYFMSEWSQRHQVNPAFAPSQGYFGMLLSDFAFQGNSNLGVDKLLFPINGELVTFMHPSVSSDQFLSGLKKNNKINETLHYNIFSRGWYTNKNSFWSIGLDIDQDLDISLPYDLFAFAKNGMDSPVTRYSLKNFGVSALATGSVYVGYSREIIKDLRVGAKVRGLVGLAGASVKYDRMDVTLSDNQWSISSKGTMNIFANGLKYPADEEGNINVTDISDLEVRAPGGYGFSVDLGATYKPLPRLTVAASLSNLGMMIWSKNAVHKGVAEGEFNFEGFQEVDPNNFDIDEEWAQLEDDLAKLYNFKYIENKQSSSSATQAKLNLSAEYSFLDFVPACDLRFGLLWDTRFTKVGAINELTAVASVQPVNWFTFALSAGTIQKQFRSVGAAFNFAFEGFNFFLATDYIPFNFTPQFVPIGPLNMTAQFGINWSIGRNVKKQPTAI